jgi:hypothetical protein
MTPSLRFVLVAALCGLPLACGGSSSTEPGDTGVDAPSDAAEGAVDVAPDATPDTSPDVPADVVDSAVDTNLPEVGAGVTGTLEITSLTGNCMPMVPKDPLSVNAKLTITNGGTASVGPFTVTAGALIDAASGKTIETFAFTATPLGPVSAGSSASATLAKATDSGDVTTTFCSTMCVKTVRVRTNWASLVVFSDPTPISCAL